MKLQAQCYMTARSNDRKKNHYEANDTCMVKFLAGRSRASKYTWRLIIGLLLYLLKDD